MTISNDIMHGRPYDGVVILFKKAIAASIKLLNSGNDRFNVVYTVRYTNYLITECVCPI